MAGNRQTLSKREQLIKTAKALFAKNGFHGTGIDSIVEKSGITKKTLYTHFQSKDELVLAVLRDYDLEIRNLLMRRVKAQGGSPKRRLLTVFDVAQQWFNQNNFYGCLFINAIGEYSDPDTPIRRACQEDKLLVNKFLRDLCEEAGAVNAEKLAEELALLLDGAIVTAQVSQRGNAAQIAKRTAKVLIEQATSPQK